MACYAIVATISFGRERAGTLRVSLCNNFPSEVRLIVEHYPCLKRVGPVGWTHFQTAREQHTRGDGGINDGITRI